MSISSGKSRILCAKSYLSQLRDIIKEMHLPLLTFAIFGIFLASAFSAEENDRSREFSTIQQKLDDLRREVHHLHNEIKNDIGHGSNAVFHLEESLTQAFNSAKDVAKNIHSIPTPRVGDLTKRHILRELVGQILQVIGIYGLLVFIGGISYYVLTGLFLSGGLMVTLLYSIPVLLASALFFPPLFIMLEGLFGLSYIMGYMSVEALLATINSFGFFMMHPLMLEYVGLATLAAALLSSLMQYHRKPSHFRY